MALQDILIKIRENAERDIADKKAKSATRVRHMEQESDELFKKLESELAAKMDKAAEDVDQKTRSMARRESAQLQLAAKRELIEDAKRQFLTSLEEADDALYGKVLTKLFEKVGASSGRVFVSASRLDITKKHAPKDCTFFEDDTIKGGFIFRTVDAEIDNRFSNLIFGEFDEPLTLYFAEQLKLV